MSKRVGYTVRRRRLANGRTVWDTRVEGPGRPDGTRRQLWFRGHSDEQAARDKGHQEARKVRRGLWTEPNRATLTQYMPTWLDSIAPTVRATTADSYRRLWAGTVEPVACRFTVNGQPLADVPLRSMTPAMLTGFYAYALSSGRSRGGSGGLSTRTVRYAHVLLKRALADAGLDQNPAARAKAPKLEQPEMRAWNREELRRFLAHVEEDSLYPLWRLVATTGLRRSELLGLRWSDLDLDRGRLSVRQTLVAVRYALRFDQPKTKAGRRTVDLDRETVAVLRAHRKRQAVLALGGLVFTTEQGEPIHPDTLSRMFEAHVKAAGLPPLGVHGLRHTAATLALQAGISAKIVSERLGHASIVVTLGTYTHALPGMQAEAAETLAALVAP
jgi:integrase